MILEKNSPLYDYKIPDHCKKRFSRNLLNYPIETMDFGYPQTCAIDVLKRFINLGTVKVISI